MKIAVVDDDKAICEAIAQLIKNQESEAEVCQFSSGKEMLETGENFAISFLDIAMEEMSGLLFYAFLLSVYLLLISKKFVRKDYLLQTHENVFLILPCIATLCISITIKMMIISVENGMTVIVYDSVPTTKFWIPVICVLLLFTIIASVILFQKLVQYNEEAVKRAILENQVRQMQKEIEEIQDIYTDMRGLRHDMRSHLFFCIIHS